MPKLVLRPRCRNCGERPEIALESPDFAGCQAMWQAFREHYKYHGKHVNKRTHRFFCGKPHCQKAVKWFRFRIWWEQHGARR